MELRDLSTSEMDDLKHIIYNSEEVHTLQILFGIIALDLNISYEKHGEIKYQFLCDNYAGGNSNYGPAAFWGIIENWISESMIYKNIGLVKDIDKSTKGLKSNINSSAAILSYTVCQIDNGISGKKDRDVIKYFEEMNYNLLNSRGFEMEKLPIETFKFIVSCLEYLGFKRKERMDKFINVNVSIIKYGDLT